MMKDNKKTYWKGIEQLSNDPEFVKKLRASFLNSCLLIKMEKEREVAEGIS